MKSDKIREGKTLQEFIKEKKLFFILFIGIILIIGGILFYFQRSNDKILMMDQTATEEFENNSMELNQEENIKSVDQGESSVDKQSPKEIMVHIVGQVKNPGVVEVQEGTRLIEAIEQLGGTTQEADLDAVNLAKKLADEEKIYIPKKGEISQSNTNSGMVEEENSDKININTASQEELKTLSGIGDGISKNIIEYREANGGFKSIEEIKEVNRIGDKIFNDIKDKITI